MTIPLTDEIIGILHFGKPTRNKERGHGSSILCEQHATNQIAGILREDGNAWMTPKRQENTTSRQGWGGLNTSQRDLTISDSD